MSVHDIVVDTYQDDVLKSVLGQLGSARLIADPKDPEEPYLTPTDGYLVVRVRDVDPEAYAREVQRRVMALRVVEVVERN